MTCRINIIHQGRIVGVHHIAFNPAFTESVASIVETHVAVGRSIVQAVHTDGEMVAWGTRGLGVVIA